MTAANAVNFMSALASAATILFLFWTITHFARKMFVGVGEELTSHQLFTTMAAGVVGALAYTFSDSFWFSAVEGEVYALSSFFTALVFWAMLKWEHADEHAGNDPLCKSQSRPVDRFPFLHDGSVNRCSLIEPADHSGHRNDLLLSPLPGLRPKELFLLSSLAVLLPGLFRLALFNTP